MALTLRQWRKAREISQQSMADKLGIHLNTYQLWEKNPGKISIDRAMEISNLLKVPLNDIVFRKEGN